MIAGRNIIAIASNWDFAPTGKHHLMKILSQENHVLWINYHGSRRPQVSAVDSRAILTRLRQVAAGTRRVSDRLMTLTPLLVPLPGSSVARQVNQKLVVHQIRKTLKTLPDQPVQLWSFAPDVDYLIGRFAEELDLYYCVDAFSAFSAYDAVTIRDLERRLIERCDVVLTTAGHLFESKRRYHPQTHLVTHGVSYDHFARAADDATEVPQGIRALPRPVLGFFGTIQDWVDLELISELARRRREWSFVLVGPCEAPIDCCREHPNIHFTGAVPFAQLPGYCKGFDVGLIPFKINDLTMSVNPIKLREYLAAGLPVVSSDLPEVRTYRPHVLVGSDADAFEHACLLALQQRTSAHRAARQASVADQTWERKVEQISTIIGSILPQERSLPPLSSQPCMNRP